MIHPTATASRLLLLAAVTVGLSLWVPGAALRADEVFKENRGLRDQNRRLERPLQSGADARRIAAEAAGGKVVLFDGKDLNGWKTQSREAQSHWKVASEVSLDPADPQKLKAAGEGQGGGSGGGVMVLEQPVHGADIVSERKFADCEVHAEVMVAKEGNSGIYLMGQYEVQVFDSFGKPKEKLGPVDMGGIYNTKGPSENASKAPGEWQTFDITFRAPRFDASGKKTENAKFIKVVLNGKTIQENVEAPKPTGSELPGGEKPQGPLMLQGDHKPIAYRNIWVKPTGEGK
jgi:hypothetical protein